VHASNSYRFNQSYEKIADKLNLAAWEDRNFELPQLVKEWLSDEEHGLWLLILDNADDKSLFYPENTTAGLAEFIPQSTNGSIIITTRNRNLGRDLSGQEMPIEVEPFANDDAKRLLKSKVPGGCWNEADASELLEILENIPLAITQAAAFINHNSITLKNYLDTINRSDGNLADYLDKELEDPRREKPNSILRTWKLSFDQIQNQDPRAAEMLSLMAVLDRQGIPEMLLRKANDRDIEVTTALGTLKAFFMIIGFTARKEDQEEFMMHRLVQLSTQMWLKLQDRLVERQEAALKKVSEVFPDGYHHPNWATCQSLSPHAQVVLEYGLETNACRLQHATIQFHTSRYNCGQGRYNVAYAKAMDAIEIQEKLLGPEHPDTLRSRNLLALTLFYQGAYATAEGMNRQVLDSRKKVLGPGHPDTLMSVNNLAAVLNARGKYKKAEHKHREALNGRTATLGLRDPETLMSFHNLANTFRNQRRYRKAEKMSRETLGRYEEVLGREHPDTLTCVNNLALVLQEQHKYPAAEEMNRRALEDREKVLGPEHPETLTSLNNLALLLQDQHKTRPAEEMYQRALNDTEKVLGPAHPNTVKSVDNLATLLQREGLYRKAEELHRRVLTKREAVLGHKHPDTQKSLRNLIEVLQLSGKGEEAEERKKGLLRPITSASEPTKSSDLAGGLPGRPPCNIL
jgi:tetratricopeptide (TPR) repeat protein